MGYPDTAEVTQAIEGSEATAPDSSGTDLAPDTEAAPITELDKLEKFKFENQEYTPQELKKAILRQADYTRKTQEFSQERRFYDNLSADLKHVRANPALAQEFKRVYPEKFHQYLEYISGSPAGTTPQAPQPEMMGSKNQYAQIDPQYLARFERLENTIFEKEVQTIETSLEAQEKEFTTKYPWADVENVYSKAQAILDKNSTLPKEDHVNLDKTTWEQLYKADHEKNKLRADNYYKDNINKQKQAGFKAKDSGLGGGSPGSSPKKYKTIKEATEAALAELDSAP